MNSISFVHQVLRELNIDRAECYITKFICVLTQHVVGNIWSLNWQDILLLPFKILLSISWRRVVFLREYNACESFGVDQCMVTLIQFLKLIVDLPFIALFVGSVSSFGLIYFN